MKSWIDLHDLPEDVRIAMIGIPASQGQTVGVLIEKDEPDKIERYIRKVREHYPTVDVIGRFDGPTPLVITLKFGLKQ